MRTRGRALVITSAIAAAGATAWADAAVEVAAAIDVTVTVETAPAPAPAPMSASVAAPADADPHALTFVTPLTRPHWEAALAVVLPLDLGDPGLHLAAGRQIGSVRLAGEYTLTDAASDRARPGTAMVIPDCGQRQRLGVAARYRLGVGAPGVGAGFYLEAGIGQATTTWKLTGTSRRRDALVGLGLEMAGGAGGRLAGFELGARFTIADGDGPTPTRDVVGVITMGLLVGG